LLRLNVTRNRLYTALIKEYFTNVAHNETEKESEDAKEIALVDRVAHTIPFSVKGSQMTHLPDGRQSGGDLHR